MTGGQRHSSRSCWRSSLFFMTLIRMATQGRCRGQLGCCGGGKRHAFWVPKVCFWMVARPFSVGMKTTRSAWSVPVLRIHWTIHQLP
ncbi:hypothetical protein BC940DRAFT_311656 [Gongronella butleri]|nr:hypothetical protein BC940DRAFT_311656 [Gongronella butleri]